MGGLLACVLGFCADSGSWFLALHRLHEFVMMDTNPVILPANQAWIAHLLHQPARW